MKGPHVTAPSGSVPLTNAQVPDQQPRPVEDLVAESHGQTNNAPIIGLEAMPSAGDQPSAPSLDPMPSAPPPAPTPPAPHPADEPEVLPADPAPAEPGSDLAVVGTNVQLEVWTNNEPWDHETIEFRGDTLNVRKPTDQALAGLSLSSSKYVKMTTRNDITGLFIARHLSEQSYDRVFSRLMDPDDAEYTVETIGELMGAVVGVRGDAAP